MGSITVRNEDVGLSNEGFLTNRSQWDDSVAQKLAALEGLSPLDQEQLTITHTMRKHYEQHESFPILASVCKKAGSKRRDCVARKFLNPMLAWKLAGLPKPSNIFFTSFDGEKYVPNPFY